jgi:hypothetical protein
MSDPAFEFRGFSDAEAVFARVREATQYFTNDGPDAEDVARIIDTVVDALVNDPVALRCADGGAGRTRTGAWQARVHVDTAVEIIDAAEQRADGYVSWGRALTDDEMGDLYESLMLAKAELHKLEAA